MTEPTTEPIAETQIAETMTEPDVLRPDPANSDYQHNIEEGTGVPASSLACVPLLSGDEKGCGGCGGRLCVWSAKLVLWKCLRVLVLGACFERELDTGLE